MCFGQTESLDICEGCKPFILAADFDSTRDNQECRESLQEQLKSSWTLLLRAKKQKGNYHG